MPGSTILSSDSQQFNNFTNTRTAYSLDLVFGDGSPNGTPVLDPADSDTYRFAVRMPSLGRLEYTKVYFKSQSGGTASGTIDFRIFQVPFDEPTRDPVYDLVYEQSGIVLGQQREQKMTINPLPFGNRVGYLGVDPAGQNVTYPRNFMWVEVKPNDLTSVSPIVWVNLKFEV